jgi:shikimate dehydrogenase
VVNCTTLGMVGHPPLRVPLDGLRRGAVVTDLVYAPLQTRLLLEAERMGCVPVDGLGMLLHQAVPGFERWFGTRPEVDAATRAAALR